MVVVGCLPGELRVMVRELEFVRGYNSGEVVPTFRPAGLSNFDGVL